MSSGSVPIVLAEPSTAYQESYFSAMAELESDGTPQVSPDVTRETFATYIQRLHDQAQGKGLKEGYLPSKEFWIVDSEGYAGRIILGLAYYPGPERVGHHVGYVVRPSKRRRGYATEALRLLLDEARKLNIDKLNPTCGMANVGSRKVIEANGGVLLHPLPTDHPTDRELRFLIDLSATP